MKKLLVILLILSVTTAVACAIGWSRSSREGDEIARKLEASALGIEDIRVAKIESESALKDEIASSKKEMQEQIDEAYRIVKEVTGRAPKIKEVIKWMTAPVEITATDLIPDAVIETVATVDCVDCVKDFMAEMPPFNFHVQGVETRLETDLGNLFLEGIATISADGMDGVPISRTAAFRRDVTDIFVVEEEEEKRTLRQRIAITKLSNVFDWSAKYEYQFSRRFGVIVGTMWGGAHETVGGTQDWPYATSESNSVEYEAGLSFAF